MTNEGEGAAVPRRVWGATGWLFSGRLVTALLGFASLAILARHLPASEFGRLTFCLALLAMLEPLADFGTSQALLQLGADDSGRLRRALGSARRIRLAAVLGGATLLSLGAHASGEAAPGWFLAAALVSLTRVFELSSVVYASKITWGTPVLIRVAVAVLRLSVVAGLATLEVSSFGPFLIGHALAAGIGNLALHRAARVHLAGTRAAEAQREHEPTTMRRVLRLAWPLALAGVAQQAYFSADNFMVRAMRGEEELGQYNAAVRLLSFGVLFATFATQAALPWLVRRNSMGRLAQATLRLGVPLFAIALLAAPLLWVHADRILSWVYGEGFEAATGSLRWLVLAGCCIHLGAAPLTAVVASGRSRSLLVIVCTGLLFNVLANLWLIGEHGIEGAAIATMFTELWVALSAMGVLALHSRGTCR